LQVEIPVGPVVKYAISGTDFHDTSNCSTAPNEDREIWRR